jgi:predicted Rossmann-fold nucleotide-binding protein
MHERKVEMARRACGFIGLPGGYGTFEEVFEVTTWTQIGIHSKRTDPVSLYRLHASNTLTPTTAVVLANVLGYFDPVRSLIQNAIKDGFIQPVGANLIKFVDGPPDHSLHESFDWGKALLAELDSWRGHPSYSLGYDWTKSRDGNEKTEPLSAT